MAESTVSISVQLRLLREYVEADVEAVKSDVRSRLAEMGEDLQLRPTVDRGFVAEQIAESVKTAPVAPLEVPVDTAALSGQVAGAVAAGAAEGIASAPAIASTGDFPSLSLDPAALRAAQLQALQSAGVDISALQDAGINPALLGLSASAPGQSATSGIGAQAASTELALAAGAGTLGFGRGVYVGEGGGEDVAINSPEYEAEQAAFQSVTQGGAPSAESVSRMGREDIYGTDVGVLGSEAFDAPAAAAAGAGRRAFGGMMGRFLLLHEIIRSGMNTAQGIGDAFDANDADERSVTEQNPVQMLRDQIEADKHRVKQFSEFDTASLGTLWLEGHLERAAGIHWGASGFLDQQDQAAADLRGDQESLKMAEEAPRGLEEAERRRDERNRKAQEQQRRDEETAHRQMLGMETLNEDLKSSEGKSLEGIDAQRADIQDEHDRRIKKLLDDADKAYGVKPGEDLPAAALAPGSTIFKAWQNIDQWQKDQDAKAQAGEGLKDAESQQRIADIQGKSSDEQLRSEGLDSVAQRNEIIRSINDEVAALKDKAAATDDAAEKQRLLNEASAAQLTLAPELAAFDRAHADAEEKELRGINQRTTEMGMHGLARQRQEVTDQYKDELDDLQKRIGYEKEEQDKAKTQADKDAIQKDIDADEKKYKAIKSERDAALGRVDEQIGYEKTDIDLETLRAEAATIGTRAAERYAGYESLREKIIREIHEHPEAADELRKAGAAEIAEYARHDNPLSELTGHIMSATSYGNRLLEASPILHGDNMDLLRKEQADISTLGKGGDLTSDLKQSIDKLNSLLSSGKTIALI
jgi:hypothetical protein